MGAALLHRLPSTRRSKALFFRIFLLCIFWGFAVQAQVQAAESAAEPAAEERERSDVTGALPRFVSLGSDKVNVRVGPGANYPIAWRFVRRGLPVEILREFEHWRLIRDREGAEGWVHKAMLSGRRTALIKGRPSQGNAPSAASQEVLALLREPDAQSPVAARAKAGAQARLLSCRDAWCRIEIGGYKGYIARQSLWGVYPDETFD